MVVLGVATNAGFIIEGNDKSNPFFATADAMHNAKEALKNPRLSNRVTKAMETLVAAIVSDNMVRRQARNGSRWAPLDPDTIAKRTRQKDAGFHTGMTKQKTRIPKGKKGAGRFTTEYTKGKSARRLFPERDLKGAFTGEVSKRTVGPAIGEALALREEKAAARSRSGKPLSKKRQKEFAGGIIPLVDTGGLFKSVGVQFTSKAAQMLASANTIGAVTKNMEGWTGGHALKWTLTRNKITIEPKGLRGKAKLKFRVHNRPTSDMLRAGKNSRIPGREFFYLNDKDMNLISEIFLILALVGRTRREEAEGVPKRLQSPLYKQTPLAAKKWRLTHGPEGRERPYTRAHQVGRGEYGATKYYSEVDTRLSQKTKDEYASQAAEYRGGKQVPKAIRDASRQGGVRQETTRRSLVLRGMGGKGETGYIGRRRSDVFSKFLNDVEHAKTKLGAKDADGYSLVGLLEQRIIDRLERAGVFELAMGVNVRQNAIKHLKNRG